MLRWCRRRLSCCCVGRELVTRRAALRARLPELGVYATITIGVLVMIGASSYVSDVLRRWARVWRAALSAAAVAADGRRDRPGCARRWPPLDPVVGAALIVLLFGYDIVSQLQVIARYYG